MDSISADMGTPESCGPCYSRASSHWGELHGKEIETAREEHLHSQDCRDQHEEDTCGEIADKSNAKQAIRYPQVKQGIRCHLPRSTLVTSGSSAVGVEGTVEPGSPELVIDDNK